MAYLDVRNAFENLENISEKELSDKGYDDSREIVEAVLNKMVEEFESWEAAKALVCRVRHCKSEKEYEIINNVFVDIFGWSLETFVERMRLNEDDCYKTKEEYRPYATNRDYSPSNPWDAPGMSIHDFI